MIQTCGICNKDYETYAVILDDNIFSIASYFEIRERYYVGKMGLCEGCFKSI